MPFSFLDDILCFSTYIGQDPNDLTVRHRIALIEIPCCGCELAVRTARLKKDIMKSPEKGLLF